MQYIRRLGLCIPGTGNTASQSGQSAKITMSLSKVAIPARGLTRLAQSGMSRERSLSTVHVASNQAGAAPRAGLFAGLAALGFGVGYLLCGNNVGEGFQAAVTSNSPMQGDSTNVDDVAKMTMTKLGRGREAWWCRAVNELRALTEEEDDLTFAEVDARRLV